MNDTTSKPDALLPVLASIRRTCQALDASPSLVYKLIRDGQLKTVKLGRATRITRDSILALGEAA